MSLRTKLLMSTAVLAIALPMLAAAQSSPPPVRIRGTVEAADAGSVRVQTREGKQVTLTIGSGTRYSAVKALDLSAITTGSFIGTAGKPAPNGSVEAIEVLVFPEEARGSGEGHYDWDLLPGSSMTNATVSAAVSGNNGRDLDLVYQGKSIKVHVPQGVPVVTFAPATQQDVKPGLAVFIVANRVADGMSAARIVVEKDGVKPPM